MIKRLEQRDLPNFDSQSCSGQRLSACTCPGENHPGPVLPDGSFPGRSAAEIDIFEAQVDPKIGGLISQSAQWAPFNAQYVYDNSTASDAFTIFENPGTTTVPNSYVPSNL